MASMGKYCKAYQVSRFREFKGWSENSQNLRKRKEQVDGKEVEVQRELTDNDILYLQENYTVTDGIFLNEAVVFDQVTPEWISFCKETLDFQVPAEAASNA